MEKTILISNFQTGSPGNFPDKRKSPSNYRRDQRRRKPSGKGVPTPGNHGACSVAPGDPTEVQTGNISWAPSSPLCSRTVPWSKHLFSPSNIPQLDGAGSFISAEKRDIRTSTPTVAPLVQYECSGFTPLAPIQQLHPTLLPSLTQTVSNKPVPYSPLSQAHIKQLQPTQLLAQIQPEPDKQEPETEQHKHAEEQQEPDREPEPEPSSEHKPLAVLPDNIENPVQIMPV